jgi:tetratricopeptide (TPR) repeat protein
MRGWLLGVLVLVVGAHVAQADEVSQAEIAFLQGNSATVLEQCVVEQLPSRVSAAQEHVCLLSVRAQVQQRAFEEARRRITVLRQKRGSRDWQAALQLARGDSYYVEGRWLEAQEAYEQAVDQAKTGELYPLALYNEARASQYAGDLPRARALFTEALKHAPWSFEAASTRKILEDDAYLSVQVGAFQQRDNAVKLLTGLQRDGFAAYLTDVNDKDGTIFRVRVGRFTSYAAAKAMQEELGHLGHATRIAP